MKLTKSLMVKTIWPAAANNEALVKKLALKYSYRTLEATYLDIKRKERLM